MQTRNYINGEWLTPQGGTLDVVNPSNHQEIVGTLHLSTIQDVVNAGEAARRALPGWRQQSPNARAAYLSKAAAMLEAQIDDIASLASQEMGKPISEMKGEVMRGVQLFRYYAAEGVRSFGSVIPSTQSDVLQYTKRVPLGVVGVITPWNFPVAIPIWKLAPALFCGNTVVWKPAENASLSAVRVAEILEASGFPNGVLNLVIGRGSDVGQALVEQVSLDGVSFTGSTQTGLGVAATAAKRNIKAQTEMGGKNAAVVLRDADLDVAIPAIVSGAFRSAGQKCTATSRVIVERAIYDEFVTRVKQAVEALYIGSALDAKSYSGPVASHAQYDKVSRYVQLSQSEARTVAVAGCQVDPSTGFYVNPRVIEGVGADHALVQEEVFGPLMALLPADNLDEAIQLTNRTVYGLSASVFTQNLKSGMRFLEEAEAGMVRINLETAGVEYQAPFGGMKQSSSHTREQGQAALDFYSQTKTCAIYYG